MVTTAFVFPGQGSQSVGMLNDLADCSPIRNTFHLVSDRLGYDLWQLVQNDPNSQLDQTEYTQVAMLTADVAIFKALQHQGMPAPTMMAGHSLGEYAALVCAEAISLPDAAVLVAKRGELMQQTMPFGQGAMAAIVGLTDEQVRGLCLEASNDVYQVSPANYNAIGQVVIAGHTPAVEKAIILADERDARMAKMIPVSVPCHCSLLNKAAELFTPFLQEAPFVTPKLPVISNAGLNVYQSVDQIKTLLKEQLYKPVPWVETIQLMKNKGIECIVECGPAKVLSGLIKRIDKSIEGISVHDQASLNACISRYHSL